MSLPMATEFGCVLGQPMHTAPGVVGLLSATPLWASGHNSGRPAFLSCLNATDHCAAGHDAPQNQQSAVG
jgi:hypothetical protein